ncbi:sulfatase [Lentisphaera profundi]|uniref:Sulfatase n=1 Tax=Lentisphaera profundi TaxID=1658616 RepID=A0ABY7VQK4_9BACT|nr:sulfatase [Lentisphaera profundi]WDE96287.1 sulfatase [Lentisphaera profundi]
MYRFILLSLITYTSLALERPNILMIAVDDLKPILGAYGDPLIQSPTIDKLAQKSAFYESAYCQQAVCGASRASIMTGLRPDSSRVWEFRQLMRERNPNAITIPEYFKSQGYMTCFTGKIFDYRCVADGKKQDLPSWSRKEQPRNSEAMKNLGFADPAFHEKIRLKTIELKQQVKKASYDEVKKAMGGSPCFEGSVDGPDEIYEDGMIAKEGVRLIKELGQKEKPFFIAVGFKKPHLPFVAPKKYWDMYKESDFALESYQSAAQGAPSYAYQDSWEFSGYNVPRVNGKVPEDFQRKLKHGYAACISYVDAQIAKLLSTLKQEGLEENTIIIFWSDHGFHLGDHGMWCKHSNYEQATRVPFFLYDPRQQLKSGVYKQPVELIDMFPTLCELSALEIPEILDGKSLLSEEAQQATFALSQFPRNAGKNKKIMGYGFRFERYRYIEWVDNNYQNDNTQFGPLKEIELYDYEKDPLETVNLANNPEYREILKKLQKQAKASGLSRAIYSN